ncbi:M1 family metallopeptidase [Stakelama saccharophila]|uniref:Aminopeptidase n=1 Tax=Stakelama saccharophila TaxID=3075605 RepID=A0ABZ0B7Z3_9SPHN|nr:M1 family metallopeptidase [Stakelama sp. W311]WNO52464.1 M1 family metallopeptidase [Stakelama sp. W311]
MRTIFAALCAAALPFAAHGETADEVPTGKLPDTAAPTAYRLDLTVLPAQDRFSGHAEIDVDLKEAASMIYMHGRDLKVTRATATVGSETFPVTLKQITPLGLDRLEFGRMLQPGKITLSFDYSAPFGSGAAGLYHVKVGDEWYSWTQFESIDARAAFPSFDEPGFKTPFTVNLTTRPGYVALSNAPETGKAKVGDLVKHNFRTTKPLPTYLMAFVVGPFATVETTAEPTPQRSDPLPVRIVATQQQAGKLAFARENTGPIVALLEKYFGERFPFGKLDQIGSPIMPGAMENAGADIYGDGILLLEPNATAAQKQSFGMVVSHELSHQWFGDLVTPAWWDDIWLNESFANWMGYRIGNEWRPDLNIGTNAIEEAFEAMDIDALKAGRPIHQKITRDADINSAFDSITYGKGGQVVAMIAAYMGDAEFQKGVRLHLKRHAYGNATTEEFFQSLADAAQDPRVLSAMKSFVDQQGVPVVTFHHANGKLMASQKRYSYLGTQVAPETWSIPLCIRHGEERNCTLMDKRQTLVRAPGTGAIMPNAGGTGYYRFDLDPADWDALIAAAPKLVPGEALALTDSLWADFYAGSGSAERLIALTHAMAANPDSNAAVDNGNRLVELAGHGMISDAAMPAYRRLLIDTYAPLYEKLGFDPADGAYADENPDTQELRRAVVGLMAGAAQDEEVQARLAEATNAYLAGNAEALAPGYLRRGLGVLVERNDLDFAKSLADKALSSDDSEFREAALAAIGGSGKADIGRWLLEDFDDARLRKTEKLDLIGDLAGNGDTRKLAADYMIAHFDRIAKDAGIFAALRIPAFFSGSCSVAQADALEQALRPKFEAAGVGMLGFDRTIEKIRTCARLKTALSGDVSKALLRGTG